MAGVGLEGYFGMGAGSESKYEPFLFLGLDEGQVLGVLAEDESLRLEGGDWSSFCG